MHEKRLNLLLLPQNLSTNGSPQIDRKLVLSTAKVGLQPSTFTPNHDQQQQIDKHK